MHVSHFQKQVYGKKNYLYPTNNHTQTIPDLQLKIKYLYKLIDDRPCFFDGKINVFDNKAEIAY